MEIIHFLVCDVNIKERGHYICYNQYILDNYKNIEKRNPNLKISFLFNKEAKLLLNINKTNQKRVNFLEVSFPQGNSFFHRFKLIQEIKNFVNYHSINKLLFMDFDKFQLFFSLFNFNSKISGILFRPHHRIEKTNNNNYNFLISLKRHKKILAEKLLIKNSAINTIFILNDKEGATTLNNYHKTFHFKFLPDPIYIFSNDEKEITYNQNHKYNFLVFGSLDERKNIKNILMAYNLAVLNFNSELLLVGAIESNFNEELKELIIKLKNIDNKNKKIIIKTGFVTDKEMDNYFSLADVCLFIYKDFYGSSGLLGRAALHKKKIIGSNVGLISKLTDNYKLGITCDPYNYVDIARAFKEIKSHTLDENLNIEFCKLHSPEEFLETLLTSS